MLTDAEVLAALSQVLSPGELSQALVKILHVPEVWSLKFGINCICLTSWLKPNS
jgi:hypothetical protein